VRAALVLLCACGRLGFEATSGDAGDGQGDGGDGGAPCNLVGRVHDTFDDGVIDEHLWENRYADPGATLVEANGQLTFTLASTATSTYAGIKTLRYYDMRGSRMIVEVVQVPAPGTNAGIQLEYAVDRYVSLSLIGGDLRGAYRTSTFTIVDSLPYVPSQHRFWAISEDAGTIHYETSADGVSFTTFATVPVPFDVSLVRQTAFAGTDMLVAAPGTFVIESIGAATPLAACPVSSLVDTFDDGAIDRQWANTYRDACCTLSEMNGEIVVAYDGTQGTASLRSAAGLDLREGEVSIRVTQEPPLVSTTLNLTVRYDQTNALELQIDPTQTIARVQLDGVGNGVMDPRNPAERYARIRETGGAYLMEVSTDRTSWRTLRTDANPFPMDDVLVTVRTGITANSTAMKATSFDDFNAP
jgi:hypothetical protein